MCFPRKDRDNYPSWNAFFVKAISDEFDWWHYWVDYNLPMVVTGAYQLTDQDEEIVELFLKTHEFLGIKPQDLNQLKFSEWSGLRHKLVILKTVSFGYGKVHDDI